MPEADNSNTPRPELPPLAAVEAEGDMAVEAMARAFVQQALRNGGRIDLKRLQRAGPSVEAAYRRMLAQVAARTGAPPDPAPGAAPVLVLPDVGGGAQPRTAKGWRDRCRPAPDFKAAARRHGYGVDAIFTAVAIAALRLLHLRSSSPRRLQPCLPLSTLATIRGHIPAPRVGKRRSAAVLWQRWPRPRC